MSWHVEARGKRIKTLNFCSTQKHFTENAPIGVQQALKTLAEYFPENSVISIICNGHIQGEGGNIRIEIQNIPAWIE
jgi:hypothetical protein